MSRKCLPLGHFLVLKRLLGRSALSGDALLALRMPNTVRSATPPSSLSIPTNHFKYPYSLRNISTNIPKYISTPSSSLSIPTNHFKSPYSLRNISTNIPKYVLTPLSSLSIPTNHFKYLYSLRNISSNTLNYTSNLILVG